MRSRESDEAFTVSLLRSPDSPPPQRHAPACPVSKKLSISKVRKETDEENKEHE